MRSTLTFASARLHLQVNIVTIIKYATVVYFLNKQLCAAAARLQFIFLVAHWRVRWLRWRSRWREKLVCICICTIIVIAVRCVSLASADVNVIVTAY
jgi:hypothetical protein